MTEDAREKLIRIIAETLDERRSVVAPVADAILAAGFRLPEAPPSGKDAVEAAQRVLDSDTEHDDDPFFKDVTTLARYILSLAPGKDVVEGARAIVQMVRNRNDEDAEQVVASFAAWREAKVRKECAVLIEEWDGWETVAGIPHERKMAATNQLRKQFAAAIRAGGSK